MSPLAKEWLATAEREMRVRKKPNHDAVCFHSQQAVEKLLKAKLVVLGREVPRSHDLAHLLGLVTDREPLWEAWRTAMNELASYAVEFRYPGESADRELAKRALAIAKHACAEIAGRLSR
jgi:HEPN domain-containing protein